MRARCVWVLGLLALGGCASSTTVSRRPPPIDAGNQGGAWEVVFAGGGTPLDTGGELARRDWTLGLQDSCATYVDWPAPDQPSLDEARRLYLPRRAHEVIYFRSWRQR